ASLPIIDGRAKISYSELEQTGPLSLHGTWSFVPSGKPSPLPSAGAHSIQVPGTWKDTDFESEDGDAVHRQGMYQLVLEMDNPRPLSLRFTEVMTESCVYLDGDLVRCQGQPGSDSRTSVANTTPFVVVLFPESSQSLIQIQVSNNHHRKGGIFGTVKIGTIKQIQDLDRQRMSRYLLVAGGLLLTALYFGLMALFERRGGSNLSLAIFCTVVLLRILTSGEKPVVSFYPDIPYALYLKIQYMTYFFSVAVALHHIHAMFPEDTIKKVLIGVYGLALGFSIFALFADGTTLSYSLSYYVFIFFGTAFYSLYAVIRATLNRRIGSRLILFGMVSLLVAAIVDFLRVYEVVLIPYLIGDAILILILCQAVATSLQNRNVHLRMGELQKERDLADSSARNNREFLSRMSHELRTPLHSIVHIGHLLREEKESSRVAEYIQTLQSASDHLLTLVNDVLDFNRLAQGKLRYQEGSFSLRLLVNRVALIHRERAAGRGLLLTVGVDESMPDRYLGDAHRISQVLHNLLGNAIKFTEKGSIELNVNPGENEENPGVRFSVADTGIGLEAEQIPDIFESYFQAGFQADRKHEGTGLGLAISRELVRLMGGELHVRSERGSGSEFFFELPLLQDRSTGRIL
ncbi:MAG: hypothetical protein KDK23_17415, partial [Leptospiraceae bacterium]|nr:hypothetical protein [Leptospiraceae bacterium]